MIALGLLLLLVSGGAVAETDPREGLRGEPVAASAAIAEAQRRLPEFVAAVRARTGDRFSLRARFRTWRGGSEFLWLDDVEIDADGFTGALADRPKGVPGLRIGQRVLVEPDQVTDWTFMREGRALGGFTQSVLDTWMLERAQQ
jgi:uncharacterized protein YegJ (DUF2314 family)